MKNSHWKGNKPVTANYKERYELLQYELWMFRETCKRLINRNLNPEKQFEKNLLVESLAIHTRILIDFFYGEKRHPDDLTAQYFLPGSVNWKEIRPPKTKILGEAKKKADKQLAHLSLRRIKIEREGKKGWVVSEISGDMEKIIGKFEEHIERGKNDQERW